MIGTIFLRAFWSRVNGLLVKMAKPSKLCSNKANLRKMFELRIKNGKLQLDIFIQSRYGDIRVENIWSLSSEVRLILTQFSCQKTIYHSRLDLCLALLFFPIVFRIIERINTKLWSELYRDISSFLSISQRLSSGFFYVTVLYCCLVLRKDLSTQKWAPIELWKISHLNSQNQDSFQARVSNTSGQYIFFWGNSSLPLAIRHHVI